METAWRLARHLETRMHAQWPQGPRALAAGVSGGADSICLLHMLHRLSGSMGFTLSAIHVHHGIRGPEADKDRAFVTERCQELGVALDVTNVDAPALAVREGLSLEDAARRLRHEAFQTVLHQRKAEAVVLAHHRDDQAETILLHLLRGAASDGLCGMHEFRNGLFRPWLEVPAELLRICLAENGWTWREDDSNQDQTYRRNALRQRWIPMLREHLDHDPASPLLRFAELQRADQALLWTLAREASADIITPVGNTVTNRDPSQPIEQYVALHRAQLLALPSALARRVILVAWERLVGHRTGVEAVHVASVLRLCEKGREGARVDLPGGRVAWMAGPHCFLCEAAVPDRQMADEKEWESRVVWPEKVGQTNRWVVPEACGVLVVTRVRLETAKTLLPALRGEQTGMIQLLDASVVDSSAGCGGIQCRNRRSGDRIHPWNAPGSRKLKDWFIDRKVPVRERDEVPLLAGAEEVYWVIGYRTAEAMCATGKELEVFLVAWEAGQSERM